MFCSRASFGGFFRRFTGRGIIREVSNSVVKVNVSWRRLVFIKKTGRRRKPLAHVKDTKAVRFVFPRYPNAGLSLRDVIANCRYCLAHTQAGGGCDEEQRDTASGTRRLQTSAAVMLLQHSDRQYIIVCEFLRHQLTNGILRDAIC